MKRLLAALIWVSTFVDAPVRSEVVVDRVGPGYAAADAGLAAGDRIDSWLSTAPDARPVPIASPFDLVEVATAANQPLFLIGRRDDNAMRWRMRPGSWSLSTQPAWAGEIAGRIESVDSALRAGGDFLERSQALLDDLLEAGQVLDAAWLAKTWSSHLAATDPEAQDRLADRARALVREAGRAELEAQIHEVQGVDHGRRNRMVEAIAHLERALILREAQEGTPMQRAWILNNLSFGYSARGNLERAIAVAQRSVALKREHVPDSLTLADSLHSLGNALFWLGDLDGAEATYEEMYELRSRLAPGSADVARSSAVLGNVKWQRGLLQEAQTLYASARKILESTDSPATYLAQVIMSEGFVAHDRRDIVTAEARYAEALALLRESDPGGDAEASTLMALGNSARFRGDLDAARMYLDQALEMFQKLAPEGERMAILESNLASLELSADRLEQAEAHAQRAVELHRAINPKSSKLGSALYVRAEIAMSRGEPKRALDLLEESRALIVEGTGDRLRLSTIDSALGRIALGSGELERAVMLFSGALERAGTVAPGSLYVARAAHGLGLAQWRQGDLDAAAAALDAAVAALDEQRGRLGGDPERQSRFAATHEDIYRDRVRLQHERAGDRAAFDAMLRLRSATIDALLAPRGLALHARVDPALDQQLRAIDRSYEKVLSQLADGSLKERAAEQAVRHLVRMRSARSELLAGVKAHASRERVDAGTSSVLVAWVLAEGNALGMVRRGDTIAVVELDSSREEIEDLVRRQRVLLGAWRVGASVRSQLDEVSHQLYRTLVEPLAVWIDDAATVTLLPDGALWRLSFAALVMDPAASGASRYWVSRHALRVAALPPTEDAVSTGSEALLVAFAMDDQARRASPIRNSSGAELAPLAHVSQEVRTISRLLPHATVLDGEGALESRVKQVREAAILHLATHAVADPRRAMDGFLVLAVDEAENGLLHAWEVYEQMTLAVDLVSLSACDTAGANGTGLLGLSWAFHAAGARKVLATQWSVNDRSTSEFMRSFYHRLGEGAEPAVALATAQRSFADRGDDWSHPFYWAAFQLSEL